MVMICFPSTTLTLFAFAVLFEALDEPLWESIIAPPMRIPAKIIDNTVLFINFDLEINLEVKYGRYEANNDQTVNEIKQGKHNNNQSCCLEEDTRF